MTGPLDNMIVWADPTEGNAPAATAAPTQYYIDPRAVVVTMPTATAPAVSNMPTGIPTRLPGPLGPTRVAATPGAPAATSGTVAAAPVSPLTPVITTPTSPAYVQTAIRPLGTPPIRPVETPPAGATAEPQVSFGRPGGQLLARPLATGGSGAVLAPPPTSHPAWTATPGATRTTVDRRPRAPTVPARRPEASSLLDQWWHSLLDFLTP